MLWNERKFSSSKITELAPEQEKVHDTSDTGRKNDKYYLVEDYLPDFQNFNSKTMTCNRQEDASLQAFNHYTFHQSDDDFSFVDCQEHLIKRNKNAV